MGVSQRIVINKVARKDQHQQHGKLTAMLTKITPSRMFHLLLIIFCLDPWILVEPRPALSPGWAGRGSWFLRSAAFLRRPMRSLTHTAKCRRFIYSPECLGIMSRKRSEGSARDIKVETSGALFELEDSRDKEKLSVRQRQGGTQGRRTFLT